MKKRLLLFATAAIAIASNAQTVSSFEDVVLTPNSVKNGSGAAVAGKFSSGNVELDNHYETSFGGFWSNGWAYSNVKNDTTPGFSSIYGAYAGTGNHGSDKYVIGQQGSILRLTGADAGDTVQSIAINNCTFAGLSMLKGDDFAKKFGGSTGDDPDFFILTIKAWKGGTLSSDSVNVNLADFRFANNSQDYILKNWLGVNLSKLGMADSLLFEMSSSDVGQFGINTPLFFCIDDVVTKSDTADFENLNLAAGKFWNKRNTTIHDQYRSGNAFFPSAYSVSSFGDYWSRGFAISNWTTASKDSLVSGYSKIYHAITGMGADSSANYAVGQQNSVIRLTGTALGKQPEGVYITNSNYAYLSMAWGDGFARKFTATDFFKLTVKGYSNGTVNSNTVEFYLAKDGNIVDTWEWVDLKPLGNADSIMFSLSSSDTGQFGMNTPAFFALDNFTTRDFGVGIASVKKELQASVYPNPASDYVRVSVPGVKKALVTIYDVTGKTVLTTENVSEPLSVKKLDAGMYFVRIESNGLTSVKRLIIN